MRARAQAEGQARINRPGAAPRDDPCERPIERSISETVALGLSCSALFALAAAAVPTSDPRISVRASADPGLLAIGEEGTLELSIEVPKGWHLWSLDPGPGPQALTVEATGAIEMFGDYCGDPPVAKFDRGFNRDLFQYEGTVRLRRAFRVKSDQRAEITVRGQICTEEQCVSQKQTTSLVLMISDAATGSKRSGEDCRPLAVRSKDAAVAPPAGPSSLEQAKAEGVLSFLLLAFVFGLGALLTPCVFPAIPLTVSFFSKYSHESFARGARLAAVYAITMVGAFTVAGVAISILFGVTGIQQFAAHPAFNLILAFILAFFALNLLGLFEITVPPWLLGAVNRLEQKFGRTAQISGQQKSGGVADYVVVGIAALTATTVFFTCTVAFVGLVLVAAARGEWFWPTLGMLAFSSAFALPFFLLAMFPQAARRLQGKAGNWLSATRVTLGFLELAAATKFLSNADLVWRWDLVTRELVLAVWVPLFALCGLYLLGKLKLGEEHVSEGDRTSVVQMLAAMAMFSLSLYLTVGLFNGRPFGGWIDGWLPPVTYPGGAAARGDESFAWVHTLEEGRRKAREKGTLVFVNYTGYTCTNCRYMEGGVFPEPEIAKLLRTMTLVELYTDGGTPEQDANRDDQVNRFGTAALPLYSVECASGSVVSIFPSSTNDVDEFRRFLADAIDKAKCGGPTLATTRLSDGQPAPGLVPGKWTLVNFWATWCGPCKTELEGFMVKMGNDLVEQGGHFITVAMQDEELAEARAYMDTLSMPADRALRIPFEVTPSDLDPRFGFSGQLPLTALVSPEGEIVWKKNGSVEKRELQDVLAQHTGYASLR
jgi:thiol:disulfide interchange protein DsbD